MPTLRIRIAASVDASVDAAWTSIERGAKRAGQVITKQIGESGVAATRRLAHEASAAAGPYRQTGVAAEQAGKKAGAAARELESMASGASARFKQLSSELRRMPADLHVVAREASKALQSIEREKARAALGIGGGGGRSSRFWMAGRGNLAIKKPHMETLNMDPVSGFAGYGMSAVSFMARAAAGLAGAAGVNTDFNNIAAKNLSEEGLAQQIVNSGYLPGTSGPNGRLQDRGKLLKDLRGTAIDTATDRGELLGGLQGFVGQTGDLQLGRDLLKDMAVLSKATGTNFEDTANAAAQVAMAIGDVPDKAAATSEIMKQIAGQGKLGAVEMRDLASQMAKIAAQSSKFKGGARENIGLLGAVAQEARQRGGAANAAQATTSVSRFVEEFSKGAVLKKMTAVGLNPFADAGHTQLKQAPDLIKEILSYTKGDLGKLSGIMPSSIAQKAIGGFAQTYNEANGSDAEKIKAVTAEFDRLRQAQLTEQEVQRAYGEVMALSTSKATQFNERIADVVGRIEGQLLPALEEMAPALIRGASNFADAVDAITSSSVFTTLVYGETAGNHMMQAAGEAERKMLNNESSMRRWEEAHLITNAEGRATPEMIAANMRAADPDLAVRRADQESLQRRIDPLAARVAQEKADLTEQSHLLAPGVRKALGLGTTGELTNDAIKKLAEGGNKGAETYLSDKEGLDRLIRSQDESKAALQLIVKLLSSGAATVRTTDGPAPKINTSGVMPAESK